MKTFGWLIAASALVGSSHASPITQGVPPPTCTKTVLQAAHIGCKEYASTITSTSSIDCGGCALETLFDRALFHCGYVTPDSDTKTTTYTACATSQHYGATSGASPPSGATPSSEKPVNQSSVPLRPGNLTNEHPDNATQLGRRWIPKSLPTWALDELKTKPGLLVSTEGDRVHITIIKDKVAVVEGETRWPHNPPLDVEYLWMDVHTIYSTRHPTPFLPPQDLTRLWDETWSSQDNRIVLPEPGYTIVYTKNGYSIVEDATGDSTFSYLPVSSVYIVGDIDPNQNTKINWAYPGYQFDHTIQHHPAAR